VLDKNDWKEPLMCFDTRKLNILRQSN